MNKKKVPKRIKVVNFFSIVPLSPGMLALTTGD
jgi:hypothetical protein